MILKSILIVIGALIIGIFLFLKIKKMIYERNVKHHVQQLYSNIDPVRNKTISFSDFDGLPEPVRRYFKATFKEGQHAVKTARLRQTGRLRDNPDSNQWLPFVATQYACAYSPDFLWDAEMHPMPFISLRILDMYINGRGAMKGMVLSTRTVFDITGGKELDTGELVRYLAESVWVPTALLPGDHLTWKERDANSALAVMTDGEYAVSMEFHFNDADEVCEIVTDDRYRSVDGGYQKLRWTGYFENYEIINGMKIPRDGRVEWDLPEGDFEYWQGHIVDVEYDGGA